MVYFAVCPAGSEFSAREEGGKVSKKEEGRRKWQLILLKEAYTLKVKRQEDSVSTVRERERERGASLSKSLARVVE